MLAREFLTLMTGRPKHRVFNFTSAGASSIVVPAGYTTMIAEAWGGGGAGDGASGATGDGGDGGGYSRYSTSVTPGVTVVYYNIGAGGIGTTTLGGDGGDSWVNAAANSKPVANGCVGGGGKGSHGGVGVGSIGDVNWNGGSAGAAGGGLGGGGGGGAGSAGNGANGSGTNAGAGGPPDGGAGGNGGFTSATVGAQPGGGGGGLWSGSNNAGNGGPGKIRLTFLVDTPFFSNGRDFDTTGLTIGGYKMGYAKQTLDGNMVYACMRHTTQSKVGIAKVNPRTRQEIWTFNDPGWSDSDVATFTGTRNAASQITVSNVTSGVIITGQRLVGTGIPAGTTITGQLSGTTGLAGVYTTSQDTTASAAAVKAKEWAGPENVAEFSDGNILVSTVDGFGGNNNAVLYELNGSTGAVVWSWNGSATTNPAYGVNLCKTFTYLGVEYIIIFGCGNNAPPAERLGIEVIRRDNRQTVFHLDLPAGNEVSSGYFRVVGGVPYIYAYIWTTDPKVYKINFLTQSLVTSFDVGTATSAPGSGWDAEAIDDNSALIATAFNGAACSVQQEPSVALQWKSAVFSEDTPGVATPTTCAQRLRNGWQMLVTSRSGRGAPGLIFLRMFGPQSSF